MIRRNCRAISIADIFVMGRHDFNARFIKHILNILVKNGVCNMVGSPGTELEFAL